MTLFNPRALAAGLVLALCALMGCSNDAETINRVQPNLIEKDTFQGAWFVRQTIVDVPPTTRFSFVGETGPLEIIRWEIREDLLVGYRAYEKVPGADPDADHEGEKVGEQPVREGQGKGYDPAVYRDNPIVAYPILDHVDIRREYNAVTGEQTNVVSENTTDRPWHERDYLRVDWNSPKVANFQFLSDALKQVVVTAGYWVDAQEGGPDAFRIERTEQGEASYLDVTNRLFVTPDLFRYDANDDGLDDSAVPVCYLGDEPLSDCTSAEVTVRTSFLKVDEERERQYAPLFYDDVRQGEFGFFRTERPTYDRGYGVTYGGVQYLANRHDIWQTSVDANGNELPFEQRLLRPIVYTLSPNYPKSMVPVTAQIAKECDDAFKRVASFARSQSVKELEADLREQTGDTCMFCLDRNEDGHARIGDLRYHFLYWVEGPQVASPLGYGPSAAHPETGRIVSGTAFVYGASVDTYAQRATDMVRLLNGDLNEEDFVRGLDVAREVQKRRLPLDPRALERASRANLGDDDLGVLDESVAKRVSAVRKDGLPRGVSARDGRVVDALEDHGLTDLLVTPEVTRDFAAQLGLHGADELDDAHKAKLRRLVLDPISVAKQRRAIRDKAERRNIWLSDYNDPAILGLAQEVKRKGLKGDALFQYLREQIYRGVMLHELGHTFGLRHNFGASSDALNFFPDFWPLREKTMTSSPSSVADLLRSNCTLLDETNRAACAEQLKGKIREYQYSSIMDYGGRFNSDFHGFGYYDLAALGAAYADAVEVFDPDMTKDLPEDVRTRLRQAADIRTPFFGQLGETFHYTKYPELFGDSANLAKRVWIKRSQYEENQSNSVLVRVPYVACYDEYRDRVWFCHTWDQGADPYEIADFYVNTYEDDYYFTNFSRGRVGFGPYDVFGRTLERYFLPMNMAYQDALFDLAYDTGDERYQALAQVAMSASFNELWSVLVKPAYGSYQEQADGYELTSYSLGESDLDITPGEGRAPYTRYDLASGYHAIDRIRESGHLYEQLAAIRALTAADASRLGIGRDVVGGDVAFSLPFYLVFAEPLTNLFSSVFLRDSAGFAARIVDGKFVPNPLEATNSEGEVQGKPIQTDLPFVVRMQAAFFAMLEFRSNYDLDFARRNQITLEGSGEAFTPAQNYLTVRFEDPTSGRVFLAYRDPDDTGRWPAAELLEKLTGLSVELATMPSATEEEQAARDELKNFIRGEVQDVDILRRLYEVLGTSPVL